MSGKPCQCGGQCGCKANALEQEWFGKTAADIRRVLSQILFPLQPHVKDFNKVLLEFSDALYGAVEDELEIVKYNTRHGYATAWGKQTYGGWESPPEYDEKDVEVPESFDLTCKVSVDFKVFIKSVMRYAKSQITDSRGFETALKSVLSNSNALNMVGKLLKDRLAYLIKADPDMITDHGELEDIISDEVLDQAVDVDTYGRPENPKVGKTWFKTTSRGVDLYCQIKVDVSNDWEMSIDYDYGRDYESEWEARNRRWAMNKLSLERAWFGKTAMKGIAMGKGFETDALRAHRYRDSLHVTDLTFAGKRGKKCQRAVIQLSYLYDGDDKDRSAWFDRVTWNLTGFYKDNWKGFINFIKDLQDQFPGEIKLDIYNERGVDVTPAGFGPIVVDGKHVKVDSRWDTFSVRDKDDQYNLPTCIPAFKGGKKDIKVFYRWVKDNQSKLRGMTYSDVLGEMRGIGIKYRSYCAMD